MILILVVDDVFYIARLEKRAKVIYKKLKFYFWEDSVVSCRQSIFKK